MNSGHTRGETMERRQQILNAATQSFSLFGYKATTIEQVAKLAQVGKGTVYNFFDNKEQLLQEAVMMLITDMRAETEQCFNSSTDFMDKVHNAFIRILQYRERHVLFAKLIEEEKRLQTPAVIEMIRNINKEIIQFISEKLKLAIASGEIRPCNTEVTAYIMLKSYVALLIDWELTYGAQLDEQQIVEAMQMTMIEGLRNS